MPKGIAKNPKTDGRTTRHQKKTVPSLKGMKPKLLKNIEQLCEKHARMVRHGIKFPKISVSELAGDPTIKERVEKEIEKARIHEEHLRRVPRLMPHEAKMELEDHLAEIIRKFIDDTGLMVNNIFTEYDEHRNLIGVDTHAFA